MLRDGLEPPSPDYKTGILAFEITEQNFGLHGTIRTYSLLTPDQAVYQIDITQR